jgi:hypothetical protein
MYRKNFIISDCGESKSFYIVNRVQSTKPLQQTGEVNRYNPNKIVLYENPILSLKFSPN